MYEDEMERYLEQEGYIIRVEEGIIDSTIVSDIAVGLGYEVIMDENGINEFHLKGE